MKQQWITFQKGFIRIKNGKGRVKMLAKKFKQLMIKLKAIKNFEYDQTIQNSQTIIILSRGLHLQEGCPVCFFERQTHFFSCQHGYCQQDMKKILNRENNTLCPMCNQNYKKQRNLYLEFVDKRKKYINQIRNTLVPYNIIYDGQQYNKNLTIRMITKQLQNLHNFGFIIKEKEKENIV